MVFHIYPYLLFRNALIFCSPRGGGKRKPLGELIDEILWRTVPHRIGNIQDFKVGVHEQKGRSIDLLFIEKVDNGLIEILFKLSANISVAVRQFCRKLFNGIKEIFRLFQFLYEIVEPCRAGRGELC